MSNRYWLLQVPESLSADSGWTWRDASAPSSAAADTDELFADADARIVRGAGTGALADFAAEYAARASMPVLVLLPVAQVLAVPVIVPQRQQRQLMSALPFLLEETLAADIERFHVIAGARMDAQRLQVVAIDRHWIGNVLALLQAAGIDPDIVTADALALSVPGTVLLDGAHSLLLTHDGSALSFDEHDASLVLSAVPAAGGKSALRIISAQASGQAQARAIETMFSADDAALDAARSAPAVVVEDALHGLLDVVAALPAGAIARLPNLRQGAFAKTGSTSFSLGFDWRPLAWLAACWAVVAIGYQIALGVSYAREAEALKAAQVELYRQVFPGSANVPRPRQQMAGQLASASGQDGLFTALVARTSAAFVELGGPAAGYSPRSLAWDSTQKQLRIDVLARSLEDLDRLRALLEQKGLVVDIGAGIAQDGGYKARMNVGEGV